MIASFPQRQGRGLLRKILFERLDEIYFIPQSHFHAGLEVIVWGNISFNGVGKLFMIDELVNGYRCREILRRNLDWGILYGGNLIFRHDNNSIDISNIDYECFDEEEIFVLSWPSESPDLNIIENLWCYLENEL